MTIYTQMKLQESDLNPIRRQARNRFGLDQGGTDFAAGAALAGLAADSLRN